jgi:hypothetical protein
MAPPFATAFLSYMQAATLLRPRGVFRKKGREDAKV